MLNIEQNLENILEYRPNWTDEEKKAYVDKLNLINVNCAKLLPVHREIIANSLYTFHYVTDLLAEFIASYLISEEV